MILPGRGRRGRPVRLSLHLLCAALALAACDVPDRPAREAGPAASAGAPPAVTDASGRVFRPGSPPERILSLVPSATLALIALGAEGALVGRTDYDTATAVRALPSVGGGLQPDLETLLSLRPDLVVRFAGEQDPATPEALDRLGIPHFAVRPDGIDDVRRIVRHLGTLTGRSAAADSLVAGLDAELARVRAAVAGREPVRVAFLLGGTPPWVAGPGTFVDDLVDLAGGVNAFADLGGLYAPVSQEALLTRGVDVFLVARGTPVPDRLRERARVVEVSPDIESPGLGLGRSAAEIARALHPGALP